MTSSANQCRPPSPGEIGLASSVAAEARQGIGDYRQFLERLAPGVLDPTLIDIHRFNQDNCLSSYVGALPPEIADGLGGLQNDLTASDRDGDGFVTGSEFANHYEGQMSQEEVSQTWHAAAVYTEVVERTTNHPATLTKAEVGQAWGRLNELATGYSMVGVDPADASVYGISLAGFPTTTDSKRKLDRLRKSLTPAQAGAADLIDRAATGRLTIGEQAAFAAINGETTAPLLPSEVIEIGNRTSAIESEGPALAAAILGITANIQNYTATPTEVAFVRNWLRRNKTTTPLIVNGAGATGTVIATTAAARLTPKNAGPFSRFLAISTAAELGMAGGFAVAKAVRGGQVCEDIPHGSMGTNPLEGDVNRLYELCTDPVPQVAGDTAFVGGVALGEKAIWQEVIKRLAFSALLASRCGGAGTKGAGDAWKAFKAARAAAGVASGWRRMAGIFGAAYAGSWGIRQLPEEWQGRTTTVGLVGSLYALSDIGTLSMKDWIGTNGTNFCRPPEPPQSPRPDSGGDGWEPGLRFWVPRFLPLPGFDRVRLPEIDFPKINLPEIRLPEIDWAAAGESAKWLGLSAVGAVGTVFAATLTVGGGAATGTGAVATVAATPTGPGMTLPAAGTAAAAAATTEAAALTMALGGGTVFSFSRFLKSMGKVIKD